jgi:hypothetical protein
MDIFYHNVNDLFFNCKFSTDFFPRFLCMVQVGSQNIHKEASKKIIFHIFNRQNLAKRLNQLTNDHHLFYITIFL